jgi:hypothetical protein
MHVQASPDSGLRQERDDALARLDETREQVHRLEDAVAALQDGLGGGLLMEWERERGDLLQDLEAAEDRTLQMQQQVMRATLMRASIRLVDAENVF